MPFILFKRSNEKAGEMQRYCKEGTLDIVVKVRPWHSVRPMPIVAFGNAIPCYLCIVKPQGILRGICVQMPLLIGGIGK